MAYTAVGGLKATFLTDFLHTAIALILIIYFTLAVLTNPHIGGLGGLYEKLQATASENYISGNYDGSLLTFKSKGAIVWGLILKFGNLALVVMVRLLNPKKETLPRSGLTHISIRTPHSGRNHLQQRPRLRSPDTTLLRSLSSEFHGD